MADVYEVADEVGENSVCHCDRFLRQVSGEFAPIRAQFDLGPKCFRTASRFF